MKYDLGYVLDDRRGGDNVIHSWDLAIRGKVTNDQRTLLDALIRARRLKCWRTDPHTDGRPLTIQQIRTFYDNPDLERMLDDLVDKGYLRFRHPRTWSNDGQRVDDISQPKGYDIRAGQMSFEITKLLHPGCVVPTIVPTDVRHIGVIVEVSHE